MGNNCDSKQTLTGINYCETSLGDKMPNAMQGFCTLDGVGGDRYRDTYCPLNGAPGEWIAGPGTESTGGCLYNDAKPYEEFGQSGCCDGECAITGAQVFCRRAAFTGDPTQCCINNYTCNAGVPGLCFSDPGTTAAPNAQFQNTCADGVSPSGGPYVPNNRLISSPDCQDVMTAYCSGADLPGSTAWLDRWLPQGGNDSPCLLTIKQSLYGTDTDPCNTGPVIVPGAPCNTAPTQPINAEGYYAMTGLVDAVVTRYVADGFQLGSLPGQTGFNPFQDLLYEQICCPYSGLCQTALKSTCAQYTAQRISFNPAVTQFCGCFLPDGEYAVYDDQFNAPPQCTPMCNQANNVPIVGISGIPLVCDQAICIIDDITLNLVGSQVGGGINTTQVCNGCSNGNCSCIVSNTTINAINDVVGGNVDPVTQACGQAVTCSQTNTSGVGPAVINVPCASLGEDPFAQFTAEQTAAEGRAQRFSVSLTMAVAIVVLLLAFVLIYFFGYKRR